MNGLAIAPLACAAILAGATLGCDSNPTSPPADPTVRFLISHRTAPGAAGDMVAATADPATIAAARAQLALPVEARTRHINGAIARGGGDNRAWSWHFVPGQWQLAEASIEVCDGTPRMVEDDLAYWVDTVRRFCPWASYVAAEL
jgi:hypothetical protein